MGERTLRRLLIIGASAVVRSGVPSGAPAGIVAGADAGAQAAHAGHRRACQQDGAHRLGAAGQGGGSTELRPWRHKPSTIVRVVEGVGAVEGEYGATVERRDRENQFATQCFERAVLIWTRSANSHTGPRHMTAASEAGQMAAPDLRAESSERFPLRPWGRPQMLQRFSVGRGPFSRG